jgi:hypothetical protein
MCLRSKVTGKGMLKNLLLSSTKPLIFVCKSIKTVYNVIRNLYAKSGLYKLIEDYDKMKRIIIVLTSIILILNGCRSLDLTTSEYYGVKTFLKSKNAKSNCNEKSDCEGKTVKLKGILDENNINKNTSEFWLFDEENCKFSILISVNPLIKTEVFNKLRNNGGLMYKIEGLAEGFDKNTNFYCERGIFIKLDNISNINQYAHISDDKQLNNSKWVETFGTITESTRMEDGIYAYTLEYNVVGGNAKNMDGELIQGILEQYIFNVKNLAIVGQKIKLQYYKEEPMFYELLEKVESEKR